MLDPQLLLTVISIVIGLGTIAAVFVSLGREKQSRVDLERRHDDLGKESREGMAILERKVSTQGESIRILELASAELKSKNEDFRTRLEEIKREKASVESVDALREGMGRVEGLLASMDRRFNDFLHQVMKSKSRDDDA